jgi:hypothetical protein
VYAKNAKFTQKVKTSEFLKSATLKCPDRKIIKIIEATYGRTDMTTCKHPSIKTTSCSSDKPSYQTWLVCVLAFLLYEMFARVFRIAVLVSIIHHY